ncbi:DUF4145 domain-containing protein [Aminobacter anthyllidis]|uniref:DUF4145 domain-containing protein n=1 Tax=Aminobacter anthyllidis TaxID=1035067 RepID=A0A9X1AAV4_9HYPH|nr:DUF4145 domain-containing protein [Aminobacter anthyllidis]MBT1156313.1 DUF4145 domain-containing protein [Aminobacter anthyllidis]MDH4988694.1 DUF4145 domain-containing protein [Aminobacter anthyllidis]
MATAGQSLINVRRCPHCSIADPLLSLVWHSDENGLQRTDGQNRKGWSVFACRTCGSLVTAQSYGQDWKGAAYEIFPDEKHAHEDIPPIARRFLQQAYETLHAPDAAAVMAGSAVDSMLKAKGYSDGSLYQRIDKALADNILTKGMADWAHSVRLGSNRPRHADENKPHTSWEEAQQAVDFAEGLGTFLFVLTARIERGIKAAEHVGKAK